MMDYLRQYSNKIKPYYVAVGFQDGATEDDGTLVALVAALNEYGRPENNQPPRPFFRRMIAENKKRWPKMLVAALESTQFDIEKSMRLMGVEMSEELQDAIRQLVSPPLSPVTIAKKGFDKPLIETATMLNHVTFAVHAGEPPT